MKQNDNENKIAPREYVAFISYRHMELDKKVAKKIHTMIERYVIPKELRGADGNKRLGKVFRDEEELPVSSNLTESIQTALDHSKFLIVICTPDLPKSEWCEREIKYFIEKHGREHVVGVLVDGTPETSFPKPLTQALEVDAEGNEVIREVEPLAANLTDVNHRFQEKRIRKEAVRLYAALLGCPFDSLWQRERRQTMRKIAALMTLGMVLALGYSVSIYLKNLQIVERNHQIEAQNQQIQTQNEEITEQYERIEEKNVELRVREAETLLSEGELLYEKGDLKGAGDRALRAISSPEGMQAYSANAEWLLNRVVASGDYSNRLRTVNVIEMEDEVSEMRLSADKTMLYVLGARGYVRCYSTADGSLLWKGDSLSRSFHYYIADRQRMYEIPDLGILICCNDDAVAALNVKDGSLAWKREYSLSDGVDFTCFSNDGKTLALIDGDGELFVQNNQLLLLDVASGEVKQTIDLPEEIRKLFLIASGRQNGVFSDDGRYLFASIYEGLSWSNLKQRYILMADLQEGSVKIIESEELENNVGTPFTIGMVCHDEDRSLLVLRYEAQDGTARMEELTFEGKILEHSEEQVTMPDRNVSVPYYSSFVLGDNNGILASCGEETLLYTQDHGKFLSKTRYSSENVLKSYWIDHEDVAYTFLSSDGWQFATFFGLGIFRGELFDKIHISHLEIPDGFISKLDEGYELADDAMAFVVCDDEPQRIYVQRTARDLQIEEAEWVVATEGADARVFKENGEDGIVFMESADDKIRYRYLKPSTKETLFDVWLDSTSDGKELEWYMLNEATVWPDGQHLTYKESYNKYFVLDVQTKAKKPLFEGFDVSDFVVCVTKTGDVLHAAISFDRNFVTETETNSLLAQVNDGEIVEIPLEGDKFWFKKDGYAEHPFLKVSESGLIMLGRYVAEDDGRIDSYLILDPVSKTTKEIKDAMEGAEERPFVMGANENIYAVADEDDVIRICDCQTGAVKKEIQIANGANVMLMQFCSGDTVLTVLTMEKQLMLYDVASGELLFLDGFISDESYAGSSLTMSVKEDVQGKRLYFRLSSGAVICVNTTLWRKMADFQGLDAYCPQTNEIFVLATGKGFLASKRIEILHRPAYTLEQLIEKYKNGTF